MKRERTLAVLGQPAEPLSIAYSSGGVVLRGRLLRVGGKVRALGRFIAQGDEAIVHELIDLISGDHDYVAKFCRYPPGSEKYRTWAVPFRVEGNRLSRLADVELNTAEMVEVSGVWIKVQRYFAGTNVLDWGSRRTTVPLMKELSQLDSEGALARLEGLMKRYGRQGLLLEAQGAVHANNGAWEQAATVLKEAVAAHYEQRDSLCLETLLLLSEVYTELYKRFENPGATKMSLDLGNGQVLTQTLFADPEASALDDSIQDRTSFALLEALALEPLFIPGLLALAYDLADHMPDLALALAQRVKEIEPETAGVDDFINTVRPHAESQATVQRTSGPDVVEAPSGITEHMQRWNDSYRPDAGVAQTVKGRAVAFEAHFRMGQYEKALDIAEQWSALSDASYESRLAKVKALTGIGRHTDAEQLGLSLFEEYPDQVAVAESLFWVFDAQGKHSEALRYALIVFNSGDAYAKSGSYMAALAYRRLKSFDKAVTYAKAAFAGNFHDIPCLLNYVYALREAGRAGDTAAFEQSDALVLRGIAENPRSGEIKFCHAQSLARDGKIKNAIETLKEVLMLNPSHPTAAEFMRVLENFDASESPQEKRYEES